jgi:hypothetical protein
MRRYRLSGEPEEDVPKYALFSTAASTRLPSSTA